jgi:type II secretory pathway pseudopilin PulG
MRRAAPTPAERHSEGAITMIEVVVATMIVIVIGAALTTTMLSSVRTQGAATLSERRLAVAEGLFERLKADSRWLSPGGAGCHAMAPAATTVTCSSTWLNTHYGADAIVNQSGTERSIRYETDIRVVGHDDALDGTGTDDQDGMRPDYYVATVRVRRQASTDTWAEVTGTINPPGRITTGALSINVCQVVRQWDERIPVAACPQQHEVLLGYPAGGVLAALGGSTDRHAQADWAAAIDRAGPSGGDIGWKMVTYDVRPATGVEVRMRRNDGKPVRTDGFVAPSGCWSPSDLEVRCLTTAAVPIRRISGLIPGHYDIEMVGIPAGYEAWPLHSIPSGDTAIVEAGRSSRVLQAIRPRSRAAYTVALRSCDHSEVMTWGSGPCVDNIQPYGLSGFLAPAASARANWSHSGPLFGGGAQSVGAGASQITFENLAPGLYSGRIVTQGQSSLTLTDGAGGAALRYMWLNPNQDGLATGDVPASGVPTYTRHWCDYDRRVSYLAGVGLPSGGGTIPHTHYTYDSYGNVTGSYVHNHVYYSADAYCASGSSGGGPPGPGSGGA